jgi:hypothetical protein
MAFMIDVVDTYVPLLVKKKKKKQRSDKESENDRFISCKLPILNKLGKYRSIHNVKKLIADYVGVYYGERLHLLNKAVALHKGDEVLVRK